MTCAQLPACIPLVLALLLCACAEKESADPSPSSPDADVGDGTDATGDTTETDTAADAIGADVSSLARFGDPCESDEECESQYCVDTDDGGICTELCSEACPDGFFCRERENPDADTVSLCVPAHDDLCDPCTADTECGGGDNRCMEQESGFFCATGCADISCPEGYRCNTRAGSDGVVEVCEPVAGHCNRIRLTRSLLVQGSARGASGPYRHSGYILTMPHDAESQSFRLRGGFR